MHEDQPLDAQECANVGHNRVTINLSVFQGGCEIRVAVNTGRCLKLIIGIPEAAFSYLLSHALTPRSEYIPHYIVPLGSVTSAGPHEGLEESVRFPFRFARLLDCESRLPNGTLLKAQRGFKLVTYRPGARQRGKFRRNFPAVRLAYRAQHKKRELPRAKKISGHLRY